MSKVPETGREIEYVLEKLDWMREAGIWPNGLRYLWTDAFGVVLLVSLFEALNEPRYLDDAEALIGEIDRVLGRPRGIRIGEEADRGGQYFHYLGMWLHALAVLDTHRSGYRQKAVELVRQIHEPFLDRGRGVFWKMREDLSAPWPGIGYGALDAVHGYVVYRLIDERALADEIADIRQLVEHQAAHLNVTQDLGLGMMLWMSHFCPEERWAAIQRARCLQTLEHMWRPAGYFCRDPYLPEVRFAFTNYGVSLGLQAVGAMPERVEALHEYFEEYRSGDEYDRAAITHVMACCAHFPGRFVASGQSSDRLGRGR